MEAKLLSPISLLRIALPQYYSNESCKWRSLSSVQSFDFTIKSQHKISHKWHSRCEVCFGDFGCRKVQMMHTYRGFCGFLLESLNHLSFQLLLSNITRQRKWRKRPHANFQLFHCLLLKQRLRSIMSLSECECVCVSTGKQEVLSESSVHSLRTKGRTSPSVCRSRHRRASQKRRTRTRISVV